MARNLRTERRLLAADEFETVSTTHYPKLAELSEKELADTIRRLREMRNKARSHSHRQRREIRGKADPKGQRTPSDNSGSKEKLQVLAAALQRAKRAAGRLEDIRRPARRGQVAIAQRALALKAKAEKPHHPPAEPTAGQGMNPVPSEPEDAFIREGEFDRSPHDNRTAQGLRDKG